jgi:hypothetical protein
MNLRKALALVVACGLVLAACDYVVIPEDLRPTSQATGHGWSAIATKVDASSTGALHVDITIRNDTGDWSAMQAVPAGPVTVSTKDGHSTACGTTFVGTGGTSLAPGFQMRGYTGGSKKAQAIQLLYVECQGAAPADASRLSIAYTFVTGDFNYYVASTQTSATLDVDLGKVVTDLAYPVADPGAALIEKPGDKITAINNCPLTLTAVKRTSDGLQFDWHTENPTAYPTYVHIGIPPVIGSDGIVHGFYESPHLADTPITPAGQSADWTTSVAVPKDVTGMFILLSVEAKQQKTFVSHAVDIGSP